MLFEEKLYLSISVYENDPTHYILELHPDPCYIRWFAKSTACRSTVSNNTVPSDFKNIRFFNIEHLAHCLYEMLYAAYNENFNLKAFNNCKTVAYFQNCAYKIILDYMSTGCDQVMYDISDPSEFTRLSDICEDCDMCFNDEDDEESENDEESEEESEDDPVVTRYFHSSMDAVKNMEKELPTCDYEDISFDTRQDAERVLVKMRSTINEFGEVCVADLFILTGFKLNHIDYKYGWTNLDDAKVYRAKDERYYLDLPKPYMLKDERLNSIEKEIRELKSEVFPNDELTARAQIKMTNKRIDELKDDIEAVRAASVLLPAITDNKLSSSLEKLSAVVEDQKAQIEDLKAQVMNLTGIIVWRKNE